MRLKPRNSPNSPPSEEMKSIMVIFSLLWYSAWLSFVLQTANNKQVTKGSRIPEEYINYGKIFFKCIVSCRPILKMIR